jgi:REP element-mobilizing transposase RayT
MPRSPRQVEPGGIYHVAPRGNDGRDIFVDDHDRCVYLELLERVTRKHGWAVLGYCLMRNHVHLLVQVRDSNLSVDLNPVRARASFRPEQWRWSSYRAHIGLDHAPPFLALSAFLQLYGPTPARARAAYKRFVQEGQVLVSDTGID